MVGTYNCQLFRSQGLVPDKVENLNAQGIVVHKCLVPEKVIKVNALGNMVPKTKARESQYHAQDQLCKKVSLYGIVESEQNLKFKGMLCLGQSPLPLTSTHRGPRSIPAKIPAIRCPTGTIQNNLKYKPHLRTLLYK